MSESDRRAVIAVIAACLIGAGMAWAGSQGGYSVAGIGIFAIAVVGAFVVQWIVFVPSFWARTERFFDLTGSLTFIGMTAVIVILTPMMDARGWMLAVMVVVWAARLGAFLFSRVRRSGGDGRFDELKESLLRFGQVWTLQGLWVTMTAGAAWIAITSQHRVGIDPFAVIGLIVWLIGLGFEVVADLQKSGFKADPAHAGRFIDTGVWSWSRHPNYFGEILLWIGVAIVTLPVLQGWQWVALASPVFVAALITKVSGIPLLEAKADAKWGGQPDYEAYKAKTSVLIPRP
jgi:steroid 5-alpha reductase family enzyme